MVLERSGNIKPLNLSNFSTSPMCPQIVVSISLTDYTDLHR